MRYPDPMRTTENKADIANTSKDSVTAQAGNCVLMKAVTVTKAGAFMDGGQEPDLLVPVSQQLIPMAEGRSYVVYQYLDPNERLIGTTKLHKFLDERAKDMAPGEAVDLFIVNQTELGYKAVVNGTHLGQLYKDEVFQPLQPGDKVKGFVKGIREDRKIDLSLQRRTQQTRDDLGDKIMAYLKANDGRSTLTDYSPPDDIYKQYRVSKGNYKKALGALYKQRLINVSKDKVTLRK